VKETLTHGVPLSFSLYRLLISAAACCFLLLSCNQASPPPDASNSRLTVGTGRYRRLSEGVIHSYSIDVQAQQYLRVVVMQEGIDLKAVLAGPDGNELLVVDSPNGSFGPETIDHVAEIAGTYSVTVRPWSTQASGSYGIDLVGIRDPTNDDIRRTKALKHYCDANHMRGEGDLDSLRAALILLSNAADIWQELSDSYRHSAALELMAKIRNRQGSTDEAIALYREALAVVVITGDSWRAAELLCSLGAILRRTGDQDGALASYQRALTLARSSGNRSAEAMALNNSGVIYRQLGQIYQALDVYEQARAIQGEIGESALAADILHNLGVLYIWMDRLAEAGDALGRAVEIRQAVNDQKGMSNTLTEIGWLAYRLGDAGEAVTRYHEALRLLGNSANLHARAATLDRLGTAYRQLGDEERALAAYEEALALFQAGNHPTDIAHTSANIGDLFRQKGDPTRALTWAHQALALFRDVSDATGAADTLLLIARCDAQQGSHREALTHVRQAISILEEIRQEARLPGLRTSFSAARHDYYELLVDLLMRLHLQFPDAGFAREALEASERCRARTLLESMTAGTGQQENHDESRASRKQDLQARLAEKELERLRLSESSSAAGKIEAEIRHILRQLEMVNHSHPAVGAGHPGPMTWQSMQDEILDDETVLLYYTLAEERSFLWLVTPYLVTEHFLPDRKTIEAAARTTHRLLTYSNRRRVRTQYRMAVADLSKMLLGPVADQLGNKRLLVVGDGVLQIVPFTALTIPVDDLATSCQLKWCPLVSDHEIIQLPSLSVLRAIRQSRKGRQPRSRQLVVFADPVFASSDPRLTRCREKSPMRLKRLAFSAAEAAVISTMVRPDGLLQVTGFDASREAALNPALAKYQMIHFATHGLLHSSHPELSGLILSLYCEGGDVQNGFLRAYEIAELDLPVELVVLSACETAVGAELHGEGVISLTRAFMMAGAARVVVTLWSVNDHATAELMASFYRAMLQKDLTPAAALRAAQIEMIDREPYYWAGFVYQGEWQGRLSSLPE
jgi:CHAT domain-containing protein/Flp pilus assembly protein TadD